LISDQPWDFGQCTGGASCTRVAGVVPGASFDWNRKDFHATPRKSTGVAFADPIAGEKNQGRRRCGWELEEKPHQTLFCCINPPHSQYSLKIFSWLALNRAAPSWSLCGLECGGEGEEAMSKQSSRGRRYRRFHRSRRLRRGRRFIVW
jgi:hypothetical protein